MQALIRLARHSHQYAYKLGGSPLLDHNLHLLAQQKFQKVVPTTIYGFGSKFSRTLTVAVGVSGGVDSAVAAMLLKQQGHDVVAIFMRNWDEAEELGNKNCSIEKDLKDAEAVCKQLSIPLHEVDFVSKYWNQVFTQFISECSRGLTPNPDLACNRYIKFDALIDHAQTLGADVVATGHYARLKPDSAGSIELHKGFDVEKDQSYFLASIQPSALPQIMFPLGEMLKKDVRKLAAEAGLTPADKRSSAGICFIGRRKFGDFLTEYVPPVPGVFIDVDTGQEVGPCSNITAVTVGQRPGIGGSLDRMYIVGKDVQQRLVYVGLGRDHPALRTRTACLRTPHWLSSSHQHQLETQGSLRCQYSARYRQPPEWCTLRLVRQDNTTNLVDTNNDHLASFRASKYCVLSKEDYVLLPGYLIVEFDQPATSITPQQAFVLYEGDQCLGSAVIGFPGATEAELN